MSARIARVVVACLVLWMGSLVAEAAKPGKEGFDLGNMDFSAYQKPAEMIVEESTPTAAQTSPLRRPGTLKDADPVERGTAKPAVVGTMNVVHLKFRDADGQIVPAVLCTPKDGKAPFPLVIAVHGLTSNKAQVCAQVAPTLIKKGYAVLAPDMPYHGERPGEPRQIFDFNDPLKFLATWRRTVVDVRQCIDLAEKRKDLDLSRGVVYVGYSMGSMIGTLTGPADSRIKAMVLMVGGAPPEMAGTPLDLGRSLAKFKGRPLLMLNAKNDNIVKPAMGKQLFESAEEPKKQIWYDSGHLLPPKAYDDAAAWVVETMAD